MIEIYKKLPGTNCGKCGLPTCMAFAIKVKTSGLDIKSCPFIAVDTPRGILQAASAPAADSYDEVGKQLEKEAAALDFQEAARIIGGTYGSAEGGETIRVSMLNSTYELRKEGLFEGNEYCRDSWARIIICDYVRKLGRRPLTGDWISLGHFPRTASHVKAFQASAEKKIAEHFKHDINALMQRSGELGGQTITGPLAADYICRVNLLPKVPLYLSFWLADEEFEADCKLSFDSSSEDHIDIEYLATLVERFANLLTSVPV